MTQDEIISMAREAGDWNGQTAEFNDVGLERFAALVAAHEREKQAEQEPMYISESCAERGCACHYSVEVDGEPVAVYSAPVRTKDLTDAFINALHKDAQDPISFARAVIAADREKNK